MEQQKPQQRHLSLSESCPIQRHVSRWCLALQDTRTPQCLQFVIYTQKCLMTDISFQAADQERNQSSSDTWKQERGHTAITSEYCYSATTFCTSCTLTCWAECSSHLGAGWEPWEQTLNPKDLKHPPCWHHNEQTKATQAIPLTQIKSSVKHCVGCTGCQLLGYSPSAFLELCQVFAHCSPLCVLGLGLGCCLRSRWRNGHF